MIGAFLFCGMGVVAGIAIGATRMGKDAEYRDREVLARKRVETILEEERCDSRCAGCPVELLCQKRIDRRMIVKDCCKLWLQQRGYEPKVFKILGMNGIGSVEKAPPINEVLGVIEREISREELDVKCPRCNGTRTILKPLFAWGTVQEVDCPVCNGTGGKQ